MFSLLFTQTSHKAKSHIAKSIIEDNQIPNQAIRCDIHVKLLVSIIDLPLYTLIQHIQLSITRTYIWTAIYLTGSNFLRIKKGETWFSLQKFHFISPLQTWYDEFLTWNSSTFGSFSVLPTTKIWKPDLTFLNG